MVSCIMYLEDPCKAINALGWLRQMPLPNPSFNHNLSPQHYRANTEIPIQQYALFWGFPIGMLYLHPGIIIAIQFILYLKEFALPHHIFMHLISLSVQVSH